MEPKVPPLVRTAEDASHECANQFRRQLAGTQDAGDGKKSNKIRKMNASTTAQTVITANGSQTPTTVDSPVVSGGGWR